MNTKNTFYFYIATFSVTVKLFPLLCIDKHRFCQQLPPKIKIKTKVLKNEGIIIHTNVLKLLIECHLVACLNQEVTLVLLDKPSIAHTDLKIIEISIDILSTI